MSRYLPNNDLLYRSAGIAGLMTIWGYMFLRNGGDYLPECAFFHYTGLYCPGCGTGRALVALAQGSVWDAFCLNPLLFVGIPLLGYYIFLKTFSSEKRAFFTHRRIQATLWILLGYWVLRNLPIYPFLMLAPR